MGRNNRSEGGGIDGIDPDAEIKRLAAEHEAQERQRQADQARQEQQRRDREGH